MSIHDFLCNTCKYSFEFFIIHSDDIPKCKKCGSDDLKKLCPQSPPNFKLVYDNKKDMVDWDGNRSKYFDKYKQMKKNGENPRIAELDGDG